MGVILLRNDDITKATIIGGNVDPQRYINSIIDAQLLNLVTILGEDLYEKIMVEFEQEFSGDTNGYYQKLYDDYIKRPIIFRAAEYYLASGAYQVTNAGISRMVPEGGESVSSEDVNKLVEHNRDMAKTYERRLEKYLSKNASNYPEYTCSCNTSGSNILGFYLPDNYGSTSYYSRYYDSYRRFL